MELYAVTVGGVYPPQCIVVWDTKEKAQALADHLNQAVQNVVTVQTVDSFFPRHMVEADSVWRKATDAYIRGDHLNTSGNPT